MIKIILLCLLTSLHVHAHGENSLGPNGGYIRMPGAFHTEVVPTDKNQLDVYLLDLEWKNPSVTQSSLTVVHHGKSDTTAHCQIIKDHYHCQFSNSVHLTKKGELKVTAQREGQSGNAVSYSLPFKRETLSNKHGDHN